MGQVPRFLADRLSRAFFALIHRGDESVPNTLQTSEIIQCRLGWLLPILVGSFERQRW